MADYQRVKEGFRFAFHGMKLSTVPDKIPQDQYAAALNIRAYSDNSIRTRPGQVQKFATGGLAITDMRGYVTLFTDGTPRILARDSADHIYLDTGTQVGFLTNGGFPAPGVSMISARPNASPVPYMYIGSLDDYQKFSAPTFVNAVTQSKVGIAEPQAPPDAGVFSPVASFVYIQHGTPVFTNGGTAGAASSFDRIADSVGSVFFQTAPVPTYASFVVSNTQIYQKFMVITIAGIQYIVQDVFPPLPTSLQISGIFYFSGTTGRCVVVPSNLAAGPGNEGQSIYGDVLLTNLRRGALVQIGSEVCLVASVTTGPNGSISFETTTVNPHTTADLLSGVSAIAISGSPGLGTSIFSKGDTFQVTTGVGTQTAVFASNPFINASASFQPDDYIHISFAFDNLAALNEIKLLIDVGDGSFTGNFYYYTIRPSDIIAGLQNTATQLSVAQTVAQRAIVDEEQAISANNQGATASSAQTSPGNNQWSEIMFPISALTRVGNDQTKTLQNAVKWQILVNANATIQVQTNSFDVFGGGQPDVGDVGAPLLYRIRPRSSVTGVKGNPSPATRYGVNPRRQAVEVICPSVAYDPQFDTWDIFRYGGSITSWRYVGSTLVTNFIFTDNFDDDAVNAGDALEFDNFEPWPTVDIPNNGNTVQVCGTIAVVSNSDLDMAQYLPGTLVQLGGQNVYTLWTRPIPILPGATYLLQFVENAGTALVIPYSILEPILANRRFPYIWGPDASGTVFGTGDQFRPGNVSFTKNYAPDSVPDDYNLEITPPSEPLIGGEILDGLCFIASTERWWAMYPTPENPVQRYNFVQQPVTRGLAAPYGHCNDGRAFYWWAKDGIYSSLKGSLTDADLYPLFPHEGVVGQVITRNGVTYQPPDYSRAASFRLSYANGYLYAVYLSTTGMYQTLVYDTIREGWSLDDYSPDACSFYHPEQQAGTLDSNTARYPELLIGNLAGVVSVQTDLTNDLGGPISGVLATFEFDGGDARAGEQWGDLYVDSIPAAMGVNLIAEPTFLGNPIPGAPSVFVGQSFTRTQVPISLEGGTLQNFLGLQLNWRDDFTQQTVPTTLYLWQPSFIPKPETIADRATDWDDGGLEGAKWVQGFILHADTFNAAKALQVQDSDLQAMHSFTPVVNHNGETEIAYSFDTPFIAHMMRIVPADQLPWRIWEVRWVVQPTPETAETWQTQATTHGFLGYMHVRQISITYASTAPVTFTINSYDGTSPIPITLPSTGGAVQKRVFQPTFNKGQLYFYKATCSVPFQIYVDKCEVLVGEWGRGEAYQNKPLVGDVGGDEARI